MAMTYKQLQDEIGRHIQDTSSGRLTRIKDAINRKYTEIADGFDWPDLWRLEVAEVSTFASEQYVFMPRHVDLVKKIVTDSGKELLHNANPEMHVNRYFDNLTAGGVAFEYTSTGSSPIKRIITTAETLDLISSDVGDTSPVVSIWGLVSGEELNELVTLNGTSAVTTSNTFSRITRIGTESSIIDASRAGNITISGTTSSTEYAVIPTFEKDSRYQAIRLDSNPNAADTLSIVYKKKVRKLINDGDTLEIPADLILFELATADILRSQAKYNQANVNENLGRTMMLEMMSRYANQTEAVFQSAPIGPGTSGRDGLAFSGRRISVVGGT